MSLNPQERLIFPLDFPSWKEASPYVHLLTGVVGVFKIGLELFIAEGPLVLKEIKEKTNSKIFLDLKLHDIPETVKKALSVISKYDLEFVTIYCDVGRPLAEAVSLATGAGIKVLGVTILTSIGKKDLAVQGIANLSQLVLKKAVLAKEAGCSGVVCSGQEVKAIKGHLGKDFLAITPGIRPSWHVDSGEDQKRTVTPREAIINGADYLVVGRPIRNAPDPVEAAHRIIEEIKAFF